MERKPNQHETGRAITPASPQFSPRSFAARRWFNYTAFVYFLLPWLVMAQVHQPLQKSRPDSLHRSVVDSAQSALTDSTHRFVSPKSHRATFILPRFAAPSISFDLDTAATSTHLFQDFIHLAAQTVPMVPLLTGEVGQPRYWASGDLPPRAVAIVVDDIRWIPGIYGTTNLTSLPDAHVQLLHAGEILPRQALTAISPYAVQLTSDSLNFNVPFSRLEYAKGPLGADAVRFRFGRALGKRLVAYLNSAFGNSDGHLVYQLDERQQPRARYVNQPYEGYKANLQLDYFLSPDWKLRYRHLNARHEAGASTPLFPEEWPGLTNALHKEERLYHAVELSSPRGLQVRSFFWQIKEELNDPDRRNRHRLRDGGIAVDWEKQTAAWAVNLHSGAGFEAIKSTSIADRTRFAQETSATLSRRLHQHVWLQWRGYSRYKNDWPYEAGLQAQLLMQRRQTLSWWLEAGVWKIAPALGERDNALPYLAKNTDLRAVDLQRGAAGLKWQRQNLDVQIRLNGSFWTHGLIYRSNMANNSGTLANRKQSEFILAAQLDLKWQLAPRWHCGAIATQAFNGLPKDFWFWHQPEGYSRVYLETQKNFFDGDLEVLPRLAGRWLGKRYSPSFTTDIVKPLEQQLPAAAVLDFQIRLRHGDGAFLFSWENILNRQFDWRYGVPEVGRYLRWGFWWNFLN